MAEEVWSVFLGLLMISLQNLPSKWIYSKYKQIIFGWGLGTRLATQRNNEIRESLKPDPIKFCSRFQKQKWDRTKTSDQKLF